MKTACLLAASLVVCAAASAAGAAEGLIVHRTVVGDQFSRGVVAESSSGPICPERVREPSLGDEVRLLLAPRMARRDEPAFSVILDLDREVALLLHHDAKTYSELRYPPNPRALHSSFRKGMGTAAADVFPFVAQGPVEQATGTAGDRPVIVRTRAVESPLLGRLDVEAHLIDSAAGAIAQRVESLAQAIRGDGEAWLPLLGDGEGLPLSLGTTLHQPASKVQVFERFEKLEEIDLEPAVFAPPTDYREVRHRPDCF